MATGTSPSTAEEALRTTDEKANFQRLARLLMCGGLSLLRDVFDAKHPPANLPAVLGNPAIKTQLKTLRRIRVLSQTEWDYLYNPSGPGTYGKSADFDISLLCKLLRAICSLTPPATGWDILPNSTDHSLEADLVRIKFYRNKIYGHNHSMEVKDVDFVKLWMEISDALMRIAGGISNAKRDEWKKSIEQFSHEPLTPDSKECVDKLRLWYLMEMETKDKLEQMELRQEQRHMEILIVLESLKASGPVASSSPQGESAQLPSYCLETRIPIPPPEQPSAESAASLSTSTELQALSQQNRPVVLNFWHVVYSFKSSLNLFISYLKMKLGVDVEDYRLGSLVLTVSCSSLEVLEALWKEYRTGHLNKVVQATLVTAEVLEKLHLSEVKLRAVISEKDYLSYKEFLNDRQEVSSIPADEMDLAKMSPIYKEIHKLAPWEGKAEMITHLEPAVFAPKLATAPPASYQLIYYLARGVDKHWRDLGRTLGLSVSTLSEINRKTELLDHEKGMTMLQEWKMRLGDDATVEVLQDALKDLGIKDPALKLKAGIPITRQFKEFPVPWYASDILLGQQHFSRVMPAVGDVATLVHDPVLGTRSLETKPVSRLLLNELAEDLGTNWRELGRILGFSETLLNYFDMKKSLSEKGNAMLVEWQRTSGKDATMEALLKALKKIGMGHLMEKVAGIPKTRQSKEFSVPWYASVHDPVLGTRSLETKPVSRLLLHELAEDLGTNWRELGRILGFSETLLNYFDMRKSLSEKGNAMLVEWQRTSGKDATMEALLKALKKIGMGHLMEKAAGKTETKLSFAPISLTPRTWSTRESTHFPLSKKFQGANTTASGYVLIMNNRTFSDPQHSMEFFAHKFGFETRKDINLTKSEMLQVLTDTAQRDFSTDDCFLCIVVSHGTADGICGTDNKSIDIETITSFFCPKICPSLKGKPKIFLIEATVGETWKRLGYLKWRKVKNNDYVPQRPVISEEDFLVSCATTARHSWLFNLLGTGMELMDAINATDTEQLWLVSTLKRKVFFKQRSVPIPTKIRRIISQQ